MFMALYCNDSSTSDCAIIRLECHTELAYSAIGRMTVQQKDSDSKSFRHVSVVSESIIGMLS